jgi:tocopherol cyclase
MSILHPEGFHGTGLTRRYFEGWYVKVVSADRARRWAIIPGLFLSPEGKAEAFVQVLDGVSARTWFVPYAREDFQAEEHRFEVRVGGSRFSADGFTLAGPELPLTGEVRFSELTPWPVSWRSPGIMDWYAYVPFMECYHGVVSLHHRLTGELRTQDGERVSLDGGTGYVEKDWGQAFPAGYVWLHSNTFAQERVCLVASIAIIPWLFTSFPGFIVGLWLDGTLHRFATYTGAVSRSVAIDDREVRWELEDRTFRLSLTAERRRGGLLHAPVRTEMHKRVEETLDSRVHVRLVEKRGGAVRFEGVGECAGLEVHGDLDRLRR